MRFVGPSPPPPPPLLQAPPPPPGSYKATVSLGEKKIHHYHQPKKSQVTHDTPVMYIGKDVTSDVSPNPKTVKVTPASSTPSLSLLATLAPIIPKTPIQQVLDEYGCADEKFVRVVIRDLKDINLDRVRFKKGSSSESRKIAREHLMKTEKVSLEREKNTLAEKLESKDSQVPKLEADVELLRLSFEKLRPLEKKRQEKESLVSEIERQILGHRDCAMADFNAS
ncbi:hypothetical protein ACLB2K_016755 [Fragaria x ananassa]